MIKKKKKLLNLPLQHAPKPDKEAYAVPGYHATKLFIRCRCCEKIFGGTIWNEENRPGPPLLVDVFKIKENS